MCPRACAARSLVELATATIAAVPKSTSSRVKALPWAVMLEVLVVVGGRWRALAEKDRARLTRLVRQSRGRPGNLSAGERREVRRLLGKLDFRRMGRELAPVVRPGGRQRQRKRR
jgi:hypothetical protein